MIMFDIRNIRCRRDLCDVSVLAIALDPIRIQTGDSNPQESIHGCFDNKSRFCRILIACFLSAAAPSIVATGANAGSEIVVALGANQTVGKGTSRKQAFPAQLETMLHATATMFASSTASPMPSVDWRYATILAGLEFSIYVLLLAFDDLAVVAVVARFDAL
jgi:hypothetical protein